MGMVTPGAGAGAGAAGHAAVPGHVRPFETVSAEAVDGAAQQGDAQGAARQGRGGADAGQPNKKLKLRTVVLQTPSDSMRSRTREDRRGGAWMSVRAERQGQGQEREQGAEGLWRADRQHDADLQAVGWLPGAPSSEAGGASDYVETARVASAPGAASGSSGAKEHGGGTSFVAAAVRQVGPSVVLIDTEHTPPSMLDGGPGHHEAIPQLPGVPPGLFEDPSPQPQMGQGSGFIFRQDGLVMTNAHVVKGASRVYVTLSDGTRHPAEVLGVDELFDLAVVRITPAREKSPSFPIANLGNSDNLQAGDWVIAVGNPFGLENTVTLGIVSNTARPMSRMSTGLAMKGTMIQTDAAINPGNSGGPLCNEWGDVIGINTMIRRRANSIGFAVPINRVKECMSDLIEGKQVAHSFLGITHRTLTPDQAKTHNADPNSYPDNLPEVSGAMVVHVMPSTPAARAGLKRFDVIR